MSTIKIKKYLWVRKVKTVKPDGSIVDMEMLFSNIFYSEADFMWLVGFDISSRNYFRLESSMIEIDTGVE